MKLIKACQAWLAIIVSGVFSLVSDSAVFLSRDHAWSDWQPAEKKIDRLASYKFFGNPAPVATVDLHGNSWNQNGNS